MTSPLKILVVDDNRDNANSLAELFELEGHDVKVAYSGEEAIEAYMSNDFDLAFMDVMMPGKNGVESFLEIRQMKPKAKVYMMTGYSVDQLLQQAIDNGALGVFGKPVDLTKVLGAIDGAKPSGIVLVAEDDPDFGPVLQQAIAESGRNCELVTDGKEALERMDRGGVEVLILDLNMPLINGIEVYTTLRKSNRAVPTVMISACIDQYRDALEFFDRHRGDRHPNQAVRLRCAVGQARPPGSLTGSPSQGLPAIPGPDEPSGLLILILQITGKFRSGSFRQNPSCRRDFAGIRSSRPPRAHPKNSGRFRPVSATSPSSVPDWRWRASSSM